MSYWNYKLCGCSICHGKYIKKGNGKYKRWKWDWASYNHKRLSQKWLVFKLVKSWFQRYRIFCIFEFSTRNVSKRLNFLQKMALAKKCYTPSTDSVVCSMSHILLEGRASADKSEYPNLDVHWSLLIFFLIPPMCRVSISILLRKFFVLLRNC